MPLRRINLGDVQIQFDADDPPGYGTGYKRVGGDLGAGMLGGTVYELPPGQSICPSHYEYGNEEWLLVLEAGRRCGTGTARRSWPAATSSVFPWGPAAPTR